MADTLREHCLRILESGRLADKLFTPPGGAVRLDDGGRGESLDFTEPARDAALALAEHTPPLPRPGALRDRAARSACLARFAHHELMAVELFAWALLRWPELDAELRRGFAHVLDEEQQHCRLYLARLEAHDSALEQHPLSGYFWLQLPAIRASGAGPAAFLAAMGLTLEQANLDFTGLYRDAFRDAGDEDSAAVCQRVHDDEVGHVRLAAEWLRKLQPGGDDLERYRASVPYPLAEARAKGRRFDRTARRRAGLDETLIEAVRTARSSQELAGRGRP
jgi:uncharacterized ferritin-like protein (DUF455 family)